MNRAACIRIGQNDVDPRRDIILAAALRSHALALSVMQTLAQAASPSQARQRPGRGAAGGGGRRCMMGWQPSSTSVESPRGWCCGSANHCSNGLAQLSANLKSADAGDAA